MDMLGQVAEIGKVIAMDLTITKYTLALFAVFPFAGVLRLLPNKHLKHFYSLIVGLFLVQWIFGADWGHFFVSSAVTYLLCIIVPKKYVHVVVFAWAMGYMTMAHMYRMYVSYMSGIFDFTGTQMVLTMKLTSFAYNLHDGTADRKRVFAKHEDKKLARVYSSRKRYAIEALPNPLEFFGYIFCFTCILAGPAFEYNDYVQSIDGTKFQRKKDANDSSSITSARKVKEPSSVAHAIVCLITSLASMAAFMYMSERFPTANVSKPAWIAAHPDHVYRYIYTLIASFTDRLKFYFAWKIAEAASVLGGFGFEGYHPETGKPLGWRGVENVDILGVELPCNVQNLTRCWNKRTQGWLERYTYSRTGNSLLATYFISAIWHGLYPGFFTFFMFVPVLTTIERQWRVHINPIIIPGYDGRNYNTAPQSVRFLYWTLCTVGTCVSMNFAVQTFSLGSWENCNNALGSYNYVPYIFFTAVAVVLSVIPVSKKKDKADKGKKKD